jgi:hypothetical protein
MTKYFTRIEHLTQPTLSGFSSLKEGTRQPDSDEFCLSTEGGILEMGMDLEQLHKRVHLATISARELSSLKT